MKYFLFLIIILSGYLSYAQDEMVLSKFNASFYMNEQNTGLDDLRVYEAFRRAGINLTTKAYPGERALILVVNGQVDGTYTRVKAVAENNEQLIIIPEIISTYEYVVFSSDSNFEFMNLDSFNNKKVGYLKGIKFLESIFKDYPRVYTSTDTANILTLIDRNLLDFGVLEKNLALQAIREKGYKNIHVATTQFKVIDTYILLNKRNEKFASVIAEKIKEMKDDGTFQKIYDDFTFNN